MRPLAYLAAALAFVAGCGWDGPARDVVAVTSEPATTSASRDGGGTGGAGTGAGDEAAGAPVTPDGSASPGLEDRPGTIGALDMPDVVAVVGDSLTVSAEQEITASLTTAGVDVVVVDAQESRRMVNGNSSLRSGVTAIEDVLAETDPDLWVVALGTNDVGAGSVPDRFLDDLRTTIATIPATTPVVWVDVWIRDRSDEAAEANAILRRELARRPATTEIVDWFSSGTDDGVITGDGIHLTETGRRRFAVKITDAVVAAAVTAR